MTFRYVVRCAALSAAALVAAGCSGGGLPTPAPAGSQSSTAAPGSTVAGSGHLPANGTVTVKSGGKVVCVMTIKNGKGTCKVSTKDYKPGSTVTYTGFYSGGGGLRKSESQPLQVQLVKPPAKAG
jgi:hypothetical protein